MYGISTHIWLICMVNVGKYTIHGLFGIWPIWISTLFGGIYHHHYDPKLGNLNLKCFLFWDNDPKAISILGLKWVANLADSHHKYYCKLSSKDPPNYPKVPGCPNQWWRYDVHTWPTIDPAWHKVPSGGNKMNKNAGKSGKIGTYRKLVGLKNMRVLVLFKVILPCV